jgi:hypothetical protein
VIKLLQVISQKKYGSSTLEAFVREVGRRANSLFRNILPASYWFQRFYKIADRSKARNSSKAKILAERYVFF